MAEFQYKAKKMDGTNVTGTIEAANRDSLINHLRGDGLYVYHVAKKDRLTDAAWKPRINLKRIAAFCNQMSAMLKAGIPVAKALDISRRSATDKRLKDALMELSERVQKGHVLSQAMLEMGSVFPPFLIYMIETGESSGTLDQIMEKMAVHYEQEVNLKGKVQTALLYPSMLAVIAVVVTVFMLTSVLPGFTHMFSEVELPMLTQALMGLSDFLIEYWFPLCLIILAAVSGLYWLMTKDAFRLMIDRWVLLIPIAGKLLRTVYTSRFAATLAILYGSDVGILRSLDISGRVLGNSYIRLQLRRASVQLRAGEMLSAVLNNTGVFRTIFISMVVVGEESGSLEQVLADTGIFYDKEADTALTQLIALLEPIMILVMGGIIGVIVLAIMLPIFQMYGYMV